MAKKNRMKDKLMLMAYDKQGINKSVLNLNKSLNEVKAVLNGEKKK